VHYDDTPEEYLANLRPRRFISLQCPDCPQVVTGLDGSHARALLAIHQEACGHGEGVGGDDDDDPDSPDAPADALRVTVSPAGRPPLPGRAP
jgi:hypothetical protein